MLLSLVCSAVELVVVNSYFALEWVVSLWLVVAWIMVYETF